jgi:hypothetical protein
LGFEATVYEIVPFPLPDELEVIVIHDTLGEAVQLHPDQIVTSTE